MTQLFDKKPKPDYSRNKSTDSYTSRNLVGADTEFPKTKTELLSGAAADLLAVVKEYVTEDWAHLDDDDLLLELSKGNEMVRNHISARAAIAKAEGRA